MPLADKMFVFLSFTLDVVMAIYKQEYRLYSENCNYTDDDFTSALAPSLAMCALQCTMTGDCIAFIRQDGACGLLNSPKFCPQSAGNETGWSLYGHSGKICCSDVPDIILHITVVQLSENNHGNEELKG